MVFAKKRDARTMKPSFVGKRKEEIHAGSLKSEFYRL